MKKRILSMLLAIVMVIGLLPTAALAATDESGNHVCDVPGSDCLVHDVANQINALPVADAIDVNNAAKVTEQIHAIDRVKFYLTDNEYEELLTLVEHGNDGSGYGLDVPTRYMQAVEKINSLTGGGSLAVTKTFIAKAGSVVDAEDAVVQLRITGVGATTYSQDVTLSTLPVQPNTLGLDPATGSAKFKSTTLCYHANAEGDGWVYGYKLPAGTYTIEELSDTGATVDSAPFVTTATSYSVNGAQAVSGTVATFTIADGEETSVSFYNTYNPTGSLTVSNTVDSSLASDKDTGFNFFVYLVTNDSISGPYGDMTFTDGGARITLKHGESATARDLPAGTEYIVYVENLSDFITADNEMLTGTIEAGSTVEAAFKHTRLNTGCLSVTAALIPPVSGPEFSITVTLEPAIDGNYGNMNFTNGTATFSLENGEKVEATGLPVGVSYKVTVASKDGYNFSIPSCDGFVLAAETDVVVYAMANSYTVHFDANGGTGTMADQSFFYNEAKNLSKNTFTRAGYTFIGWNTNEDQSGTSYEDELQVSDLTLENGGTVTLYAMWEAAPTPPVYDPPVYDPPVHIHICTSMCDICGGCEDAMCIDSACKDKCLLPMTFHDVAEGMWYTEAVEYVYHRNMMQGVGNNLFDIDGTTTRAMIVAILWRMEGEPVVNYLMQFEDVPTGTWYTEAVRWAASEKIVEGYGNTFGPTDPITREQFVAILWRYAKYKGYDVSVGENTNILSYDDAFSISKYAIPAMQWACGSGVMEGDNVKLTPTAPATRSQAAALFQRFCENVVKK